MQKKVSAISTQFLPGLADMPYVGSTCQCAIEALLHGVKTGAHVHVPTPIHLLSLPCLLCPNHSIEATWRRFGGEDEIEGCNKQDALAVTGDVLVDSRGGSNPGKLVLSLAFRTKRVPTVLICGKF